MSHFAKVEDGVVVRVYVPEQDWVDAQADSNKYVQTSYNTRGGKHYDPDTGLEDDKPPLRKNYAGTGAVYDSVKNAFYAPQPFPSWTLNEDTCWWEAPVAYPADATPEKPYTWDEDTTSWVEVTEE